MVTQFPQFIYGIHDLNGAPALGSSGWVVDSVNLRTQTGNDYRALSAAGIEPIVRLNNGYGSAGTIPTSIQYDTFAAKCAAYVSNAPGARVWLIGNEMNHADEQPVSPDGTREAITPQLYAQCFLKCRAAIKALPGHATDWVVPGAVAPYNAQTKYPGNTRADWVQYFVDILNLIGNQADALALHCYTQEYQLDQITSEATFQPPFTDRRYYFRTYRDFLSAVPAALRSLPVLITETNPTKGWGNSNIGWVRAAYAEINSWNAVATNQPIQALALYRWENFPDHPEWSVTAHRGVQDDLTAAIALGYRARYGASMVPTITQVTFTPTTLGAGGNLQVSITVRNDSNAPLSTQDPNPGFVYEEGDTFQTRGFPDAQGAYRVGIDFDGRTGIDHPYRWGLGSPLAPGETRLVSGAIHLKTPSAKDTGRDW